MLYFASDFHLGLYKQDVHKQEQKIIVFLNYAVSNGAKQIFLVGDIFDFWFEYKRAVPKGYFRLFYTFHQIVNSGIKITLFKGNHDMWMFDYLEKECGVEIITNELELEYKGKTFFIHHGDGLGPGDYSYKFIKKIFRSKLNQWLFSRLHPNFGLWLGELLSKKSRLAKSEFEKKDQYMGDDKEFLTQFVQQMVIKKPDIDYYIFGHRHLPLNIAVGHAHYINLGEWIHHNTYAVFDGQKMELKTWNA